MTYDSYEETTFERADRLQQERKHELDKLRISEAEQTKRAKYKRSEARQDTLQVIGGCIIGAVVILGIVAAIFFGTRGDDGPGGIGREERREIACIQDGGGWVPEDLLSTGDDGICVYPGKRVEVPAQ